MPDFSPFVGLEYEALGRGPKYDCWGLVEAALRDCFDILTPEYRYTSAGAEQALLFRPDGWVQVIEETPGDVALIRRPDCHCGLVVAPGRLLHISRRLIYSVIDRYHRPAWGARIEGFWRWSGTTP